jgi:hypothetical protein
MKLANRIIELCKETDPKVQRKIQMIVAVCGETKSAQIFKEACGLYSTKLDWLTDPDTQEKRLRTLGGCFFKIARKRMNTGEKKAIKQLERKKEK